MEGPSVSTKPYECVGEPFPLHCELTYYFGRNVSKRTKRYILRSMKHDYKRPPAPLLIVLTKILEGFQNFLRDLRCTGDAKLLSSTPVNKKVGSNRHWHGTCIHNENVGIVCKERTPAAIKDCKSEAEADNIVLRDDDNKDIEEDDDEGDFKTAEDALFEMVCSSMTKKVRYITRKILYECEESVASLIRNPTALENAVQMAFLSSKKKRTARRRRGKRAGRVRRTLTCSVRDPNG